MPLLLDLLTEEEAASAPALEEEDFWLLNNLSYASRSAARWTSFLAEVYSSTSWLLSSSSAVWFTFYACFM